MRGAIGPAEQVRRQPWDTSGGHGIRTHEDGEGPALELFKSSPFGHSGSPPGEIKSAMTAGLESNPPDPPVAASKPVTDRSRPPGAPDEHTLPGGNVGGAVRVGDTVRRPAGPWTPAVHALLHHLAAAGLDSIPDVRGFDDQGREILGFLPGRSVDVDAEVVSDALLAAAVRWVRRFHDAVATYRPAGPVRWRNTTSALEPGEIICHHDAGAYNWIVDGDDLVGVIDWDMAGPGRPIDDLAFMAWNSLPLYREIPIDDVLRRLRLMADNYRGASPGSPGSSGSPVSSGSSGSSDPVSPRAILAHVDARMTSAADRIEAGQRAGDPGMLNLATVGEPARTRRRLAALRERIVVIEALAGVMMGRGR